MKGKYFELKKIKGIQYRNILTGLKQIVIEDDNEKINNQLC